MTALFVTDPLPGLDAGIDSSVGLMAAAQDHRRRGLGLRARGPRAGGRPAGRPGAPDHAPAPDAAAATTAGSSTPPWYDEDEHRGLDVADEVDAVFTAAGPAGRPALPAHDVPARGGGRGRRPGRQRPGGVRQVQEKLFPLRFPELCPATLVTADAGGAADVPAEPRHRVVKPVDGFSGIDVWLVRADDPQRPLAGGVGHRPRSPARAVPGVPASSDRRQQAAVPPRRRDHRRRRPASPRPRTSGSARRRCAAEPDARDRRIVAALAPDLLRHGIALAGLDVIDGRLIEVNVTCPGGMHKTDALLGTDLSGEIVRRLLPHRSTKGSSHEHPPDRLCRPARSPGLRARRERHPAPRHPRRHRQPAADRPDRPDVHRRSARTATPPSTSRPWPC